MLLFFAGVCGEKSYEVSKFWGGLCLLKMNFWKKNYSIFDYYFFAT